MLLHNIAIECNVSLENVRLFTSHNRYVMLVDYIWDALKVTCLKLLVNGCQYFTKCKRTNWNGHTKWTYKIAQRKFNGNKSLIAEYVLLLTLSRITVWTCWTHCSWGGSYGAVLDLFQHGIRLVDRFRECHSSVYTYYARCQVPWQVAL